MRHTSWRCTFLIEGRGSCATVQVCACLWVRVQELRRSDSAFRSIHPSKGSELYQLTVSSWVGRSLYCVCVGASGCWLLFSVCAFFLFVCVSQQNQVLQISVCVTDECVHSQLSLHSHSAGSVGLHLAKQELNQLLIEQRNRAWFSVTQSQNLHDSIFPNNDHINPLSLTVVMSCISYLVHDFLLLCVILPQWHHLPPQNVILPTR